MDEVEAHSAEERLDAGKERASGKPTVLKSKYVRWIKALCEALQEQDGKLKIEDAYHVIAEREGVQERDLRQGNLLAWARNYLADEGYLDRGEEAKRDKVWRLTEAGSSVKMTDELASTIIRNKNTRDRARREEQEGSLGDADIASVHYWLYALGEGARMWDEYYRRGVMGVGWRELGDLKAYASKADIRSRLQEINESDSYYFNAVQITWQFANDVKPGDVVFAKRGRSEILGRGVVTGEYEYDKGEGRYPNLRSVRWTHRGRWAMDGNFAIKTLTEVTDYTDFVTRVSALFEGDEGEPVEEKPAAALTTYGKEDFLSQVFMDEVTYDTLVGVLRSKKNVILQGAPGVGKTFVAKRLAYSMMGVKDPERVMMVQFHQSYSYEDFIEGYRPSADGFELEKGAFYTFCKRAAEDDENDYFFIIDEINRGNLSKIFGELFMLIENDKRGPKNKLRLLYSRELFHVPSNVYLIGMMNTADRSLAMLDYALRRRFAFFDLGPAFDSDGFVAYRDGLGSARLNELLACVVRLNEAIAADETLGEGFCVGHSYFCGMRAEDMTDARLSAIVEYELIPMLREYWFDEPSKVREWADALRRSLK